MIGTDLLVAAVYEDVLTKLTAYLYDPESTLSVEATYYLSKTIARIAANLGKKWASY